MSNYSSLAWKNEERDARGQTVWLEPGRAKQGQNGYAQGGVGCLVLPLKLT